LGRAAKAQSPGRDRSAFSSIAPLRRPATIQTMFQARATGLLLILLAFAVSPTLVADIPAMADYPAHLARMHLLVADGTADANPFYEITWRMYPNLGMDLIVPQIARFVPVESATRVFFLFTQLLLVSGAIALELAVKRRHELSGFAALLALHSLPFSLGLINFEFGMAIALWGAASWIAVRERSETLRFAVHAGFVAALFVAHFFALGIYGATLGVLELQRTISQKAGIRDAARSFALLVVPALAVLGLMVATGGSIGERGTEWILTWKPIWLFLALNGYSIHVAAASAAILGVTIAFLLFKKSLQVSGPGKWLAVAFLLLFIAMPSRIVGTKFVDIRLLIAAILIVPAFATIEPVRRAREVAAAAVSAIVLTNSIVVGKVWLDYQREYAALKSSFKHVKRGATVLVGWSDPGASSVLMDAPMKRGPTLAVYYAAALVPSFYTNPGAQPIELRKEFRRFDIDIATESYDPPPVALLALTARNVNPPDAPAYLSNWVAHFDYLYLVGPRTPNPLPELLEEAAGGERFALYRIKK